MFHIGQLIIIGGPSCAGKTLLIKKIQEGRYPRLCEQLGLAAPHWWLYVDVFMLGKTPRPIIERLVVHYDFSSHYNRHKDEFDYLRQLVGNSNSAIVLTLCVSPKILVRRMTLRFIKEFVLLLHKPKIYRENIRRCRCFESPSYANPKASPTAGPSKHPSIDSSFVMISIHFSHCQLTHTLTHHLFHSEHFDWEKGICQGRQIQLDIIM